VVGLLPKSTGSPFLSVLCVPDVNVTTWPHFSLSLLPGSVASWAG